VKAKNKTAPLFTATPPEPEKRSPFWWLRWVPTVVFAIILLNLIILIGGVALVPVMASFALAYILNPLVSYLQKRGISQPLAAFTTLIVIHLCVVGFLLFIIPGIWQESLEAGQTIAQKLTPENAVRTRASLRRYSPVLDKLVGARVERFIRDPSELVGSPSTWFAGGLSEFLAAAAASFDLFLVPFFVYYILVDFRTWRDFSEDLIPPRFRDTFSRLFDEVGRILQSYVRGQLLIAMIMGGMYAIGFAALRVPAWAGLAVLSGFLNLVPYVGTLFGIVLATAFTLADGGGFWRVTGVLAVFAVVQMVEGYYLTPKILGGRLQLHPMAVFLGLLIGGKLFGFLGIVLAVPTLAVAKVFLMFLRELYKGSYFYHKGEISPREAPSEIIEERLAEAADTVLLEQVQAESGDELLAPGHADDDPVARHQPNPT
jgi:predicted PurR-regulated permease PerM